MAYQDIERWQQMSKDELYQELVKSHDDVSSIDKITHIYVNNCYELGAETDGYASHFFVSLYPKGRRPLQESIEFSENDLYLGDVYQRRKNPYVIDLDYD